MSLCVCRIYRTCAVLLAAALVGGVSAEIAPGSLTLSGFVSMEAGQFVNYKYRSTDFSHKWLQKNKIGMSVGATIHPRVQLSTHTGFILTYNTTNPTMITNPDDFAYAPIGGFFIDRAEIAINCSPDEEGDLLSLGIGLWQQKYNHEARNLGEYLFRSGAYPGYIYQSGFDECFLNLAGIHIDNTLWGFWKNQLLLTSELWMQPFNDFSLAYLTDVTLGEKMLTVGGGVQLYRVFSVDPNQTSQKTVWKNGVSQGPAPNYYLDSVGVDEFGIARYDTLYYTFAGTKLMVRATFDPKSMFGGIDALGADDLKLYGEIAILGTKNYPNNLATDNPYTFTKPVNKFGFDTLLQKMPMMLGINMPTWKLLDLLNVEVEYYGKKYVNAVPIPCGTKTGGYYAVTTNPVAAAKGGVSEYDSLYEKGGAVNWKWSIYAKKTIFNNFTITGQFARDHILNTVKGLSMLEVDREEALVKAKHYYWMVKFAGGF